MAEHISWCATILTIVAASMTAANLGSRITGYGFVVFAIGAIAWAVDGALTHQAALLWTNVLLALLDLFGIWRWLGRQAEVEKGGRTAASSSQETASEALFPVSMLASAEVCSGSVKLGRCIDAMAGCMSGRVSYVVVSAGGVAGVGETLRRLPWKAAKVEGEVVSVSMASETFEQLESLPRDEWPGR